MSVPIDSRREHRRRAMLEAAASLFMEKGYSATSLEDVVKRSGGSLKTLYDLFSNKQGLLQAIIGERCEHLNEVLDNATLQGKAPREALRFMAAHVMDELAVPEGVALLRVIIAECQRLPEIGQLFFAAGPSTGERKVADYLRGLADKGLLAIDDANAAAVMFFQMAMGHFLLQALCGIPIQLSEAERQRHIDRVVDAFLKIHEVPADAAHR